MKNTKVLIRIGLVLFISAITRGFLESIGGFGAFGVITQLVILLLISSVSVWVLKKEKKKMNEVRYKIAKSIVIFLIIASIILSLIAIINSKFPQMWEQYKGSLIVPILVIIAIFSLKTAIFTIKNIKNID